MLFSFIILPSPANFCNSDKTYALINCQTSANNISNNYNYNNNDNNNNNNNNNFIPSVNILSLSFKLEP